MRGGGIAGVLTLIVVGVIIADVLIHPAGVKAASSGINGFWKTSTGALLGKG